MTNDLAVKSYDVLSRRRGWTLALVATFTMAISYLDRQVLAVLAPTVTKALEIDDTSYGLLASAFSVAYLIGSPIAGRLIDRHGARGGCGKQVQAGGRLLLRRGLSSRGGQDQGRRRGQSRPPAATGDG